MTAIGTGSATGQDEEGGEVLEYALIAGLIIVAAIAAVAAVGNKVLARWTSLQTPVAGPAATLDQGRDMPRQVLVIDDSPRRPRLVANRAADRRDRRAGRHRRRQRSARPSSARRT